MGVFQPVFPPLTYKKVIDHLGLPTSGCVGRDKPALDMVVLGGDGETSQHVSADPGGRVEHRKAAGLAACWVVFSITERPGRDDATGPC